jgi:hypothetical protein
MASPYGGGGMIYLSTHKQQALDAMSIKNPTNPLNFLEENLPANLPR